MCQQGIQLLVTPKQKTSGSDYDFLKTDASFIKTEMSFSRKLHLLTAAWENFFSELQEDFPRAPAR
jgi:hypothetical protein